MDNVSLTLREVLAFLSGLAIAIPSYISLYRNWKRSRIEEREVEARTHLTLESATSLRLRDDLAAGEGVGRMLSSLIETGEKLTKMQEQMYEMQQLKTRLALAQHFNKKAKALLDYYEIPFSEADNLPTSKPEGMVRE